MVENYLANPYTPGAGKKPKYLAGRQKALEEAYKVVMGAAHGIAEQSIIYYGLRGVGKTVLLNEIERMADQNKVVYEHLEAAEQYSFTTTIALGIQKLMRKISVTAGLTQYLDAALGVLKSFQLTYGQEGTLSLGMDKNINKAVGYADTGDFATDLTDLLLALGDIAMQADRGALVFIDEIQYLHEDEFAALISAIHRIDQKGYPIVFIGAGLPKIVKLAGDTKSYSERLFQFIPMGSLEGEAAQLALSEPARKLGVAYDQDALDYIVAETGGYPYFLQEYGRQVWAYVENKNLITLQAAQKAKSVFLEKLDNSFFKARHDRATAKELEFMKAMVMCASLPCTISQIAEVLHKKTSAISTIRAQLIHKGFVYAANRGELAFTVPQFDQYLKRIYEL